MAQKIIKPVRLFTVHFHACLNWKHVNVLGTAGLDCRCCFQNKGLWWWMALLGLHGRLLTVYMDDSVSRCFYPNGFKWMPMSLKCNWTPVSARIQTLGRTGLCYSHEYDQCQLSHARMHARTVVYYNLPRSWTLSCTDIKINRHTQTHTHTYKKGTHTEVTCMSDD